MKIDVMTATRAEYGLMRQLLFRMLEDPDIELRLLVTGTHLSERFGMTKNEIIADDIPIYKEIEILSDCEGNLGTAQTMANALVEFTKHFREDKPDFLLVDGDRYESFAICMAAVNCNVPIIHCGGGATTEGATDEYFRHCMTKMAYLHFPTTEIYRHRIIQMGEDPRRVFAVGSPGLENILKIKYLTRNELEESINFKLDRPFSVVTFHPVTIEDKDAAIREVKELLAACSDIEDMKFIFTMANADNGGNEINEIVAEFIKTFDRGICVQSLGALRYLSALKYCEFVLGNSSSGLIEAPSFQIPTVNIGDRQRGRIKADSVIDCLPEKNDIKRAIEKARSKEFREKVCNYVVNPNGDGHTSERIVETIKSYARDNRVDLMKKFYDVDFKN